MISQGRNASEWGNDYTWRPSLIIFRIYIYKISYYTLHIYIYAYIYISLKN